MRGKRVCGPRRVVLLASVGGEYGINGVVFDDALDLEKTDVKQYWKDLFNSKFLVFSPGEEPTWFTIHPMTPIQIRNEPEEEKALATWRVLCSLSKIENYHIIDDDGNETMVKQPDRMDRGQLGTMASETWLDTSGLTMEDILGLSIMIKQISEPQLPFFSPLNKPSGHSEKKKI